jgi:hypothetical protein
LCCRCGGHGEGLVLPRYHSGHGQRLARGRGRWSAAWERTRSAVAEASGGAGALGLERRRRRRATSSATGAAGGTAGEAGGATGEAGSGAERWRFGGGEGLEWWGPRVGMQNRETAGAICVLGMKIFLLHPQ